MMLRKIFLFLLCWCTVVVGIGFSFTSRASASEPGALTSVRVQLRWKHQFQFAGYYAALEKGFYRDAGFSVQLREGGHNIHTVDEVVRDRADYGVTNSEILLARLREGKKVTVLAAVFQHSPLVLVSRKSEGIRNPQDLVGRTVKMTTDIRDSELQTMLSNEGVSLDRINLMEGETRKEDYFNEQIDALSAYVTSEPYFYEKNKIPYTVIKPLTYGVDFYGDCLFTSESRVRNTPKEVRAFRKASLEGWEYAMAHKDEIIDLIRKKYNSDKSEAHLEYEAEAMEKLIMPSLIELGHINPGRWRHIADTYARQGLVDKSYSLEGFLYEPGKKEDGVWIFWVFVISTFVTIPVMLVAFFLYTFNRRLNREVFEREQAEERLREREARLKVLFEDAPDALMVSNDKDDILDVNAAAGEMLGYTEQELLNMRIPDLQAPEVRGEYGTVIKTELMHGLPFEGLDVTKDGKRLPVEIHVKAIHLAGERLALSIIRDISGRKRAEEEKRQAQKQAADQEKNALVGQVAGKMAHDFNNVLGAVMGNAELLRYECSEENVKARLKLILEQTERGRVLTRNLVAFAKDQEPRQEFFSVSEKIDLVVNLLKRDLEGIEVKKDYARHLPDLLADPGMIEHALVNMIQNSIHALSKTDDPAIRIRTYGNSEMIHIEIGDNGCGIPDEHKENIYTPSFTLKGSRDNAGDYASGIKGTGYGMANVKKYVAKNRGFIDFTSSPGRGTVFTISLPVLKKRLSGEEKKTLGSVAVETGKQILLVEDEPAIYEVQQRILSESPFFHKVDIAVDGKTAKRLFAEKGYDMVSLDYLLTGSENGMDVYNFIRKQDPWVPILFISGNLEFIESIKSLKQKDEYLDHIAKPCRNLEYVNRVNRFLKKGILSNRSSPESGG